MDAEMARLQVRRLQCHAVVVKEGAGILLVDLLLLCDV